MTILTAALLCGGVIPVMLSAGDTVAKAPDTAFTLDPARRAANFDRIAKDFEGGGNALAAFARAFVDQARSGDPFTAYLARYGMRADDLADVSALAWFSAVMLADGGNTSDPTPAQLQGIRALMAGKPAAAMAALTPQQRQDAADQLLFLTFLQQAAAERLADTEARDRWLDGFARLNSQLLGFDVSAMRVGPNGLLVRDSETAFETPRETSAPVAGSSSRTDASQFVNLAGSAIAGVDYNHRLENRYGMNGLELVGITSIFVLFKDGSACIDCLDAIVQGKLAEYAQENPGWFGSWKRAGAEIVLTRRSGDTDRLRAADLALPAAPGTRLSGRFRGVDSGYGATSIRDLEFRPDGSLIYDSSTSSVTSSYVMNYEKGAILGRYHVDGYRIRMQRGDGEDRTVSFVRSASEPGVLIIDGIAYALRKDGE